MDCAWSENEMSEKLAYKMWKKLLPVLPMITVDVIVKDRRGVLLSKRDIPPFKGYWHVPGSFLRFGESFEEAVKRVVKGETGLKVKIIKHGKFYDLYKKDPRGHIITLTFICKPLGGKLRGSFQARNLKFFKRLPKKTIYYQKHYLQEQV